jgi:hypothetical protein
MENVSTVIGDDVPCMKCGYNLRTLAADGKCPECGANVAMSVQEKMRRALVRWGRIAEAAIFFLALLLMPWAWQRTMWDAGGFVVEVVTGGIMACGFIYLLSSGQWARGGMRKWRLGVWSVIGLMFTLYTLAIADSRPFWLSFRPGLGFLSEIPTVVVPLDMLFRGILLALAAELFRQLPWSAARRKQNILHMLALLATSILYFVMAAGEATWLALYRGMNPTPWDWLLKLIFDWSPRVYWTQFAIQIVIWPLVIVSAYLEWRRWRRAQP